MVKIYQSNEEEPKNIHPIDYALFEKKINYINTVIRNWKKVTVSRPEKHKTILIYQEHIKYIIEFIIHLLMHIV